MNKKIVKFFNIEKLSLLLKKKGKKIVHCHGVFDLLHIGHLKHFKSAKKFGDILIVSITPDKFVHKGLNRPYFNAQQRLESLASIEIIDFVVLNNSPDSINIIKFASFSCARTISFTNLSYPPLKVPIKSDKPFLSI